MMGNINMPISAQYSIWKLKNGVAFTLRVCMYGIAMCRSLKCTVRAYCAATMLA